MSTITTDSTTGFRTGTVSLSQRRILRIEGLAALAAGLWAYFTLDGPLWLLAVLALAPDLSMLAYLAGTRIGSLGYNFAHTYTVPIALGGLGVWTGTSLVILIAAVWIAHIGADRLLGYGLKSPSGFKDTHLSPR